ARVQDRVYSLSVQCHGEADMARGIEPEGNDRHLGSGPINNFPIAVLLGNQIQFICSKIEVDIGIHEHVWRERALERIVLTLAGTLHHEINAFLTRSTERDGGQTNFSMRHRFSCYADLWHGLSYGKIHVLYDLGLDVTEGTSGIDKKPDLLIGDCH